MFFTHQIGRKGSVSSTYMQKRQPFKVVFLVEHSGVEPLASSMRTRRTTNCANAPYCYVECYPVKFSSWCKARRKDYQLCQCPMHIYYNEKKDYVKRKIGHALNKAAPSFFKREPLAALLIGLVNLCLMLWTYSAPAMCSAVCKMNTKMARIPVALYPISVRHTVHGGGEIPSR